MARSKVQWAPDAIIESKKEKRALVQRVKNPKVSMGEGATTFKRKTIINRDVIAFVNDLSSYNHTMNDFVVGSLWLSKDFIDVPNISINKEPMGFLPAGNGPIGNALFVRAGYYSIASWNFSYSRGALRYITGLRIPKGSYFTCAGMFSVSEVSKPTNNRVMHAKTVSRPFFIFEGLVIAMNAREANMLTLIDSAK